MRNIKHQLLLLSVLILLALSPVVSAEEQVTKITYIGFSPSEGLEMASETNDYSDLIEYTYIPAYNATYYANDTLLAAAESGFLGTQDVILCDMVGSKVYNSQDGLLNDTLKAAHDSGSSLYSIRSVSSTPSYFDYVSDGNADDPICNYYNNMDTAGEGLDNAENLLLYLTMKTKVVYIGFSPSEGLEMASETNDYSDLIEYTYIPAYNATYYANDTLLAAAESGFLGTQDVVLCDMVGSKVYNSQDGLLNDTLKAAHDSGSSLYSIRSVSSTPSYFDYVSDGNADDPICNYYNNMDTAGEGLDNAENLLLYLTMKTKVVYIGFSPSEGLEMASETNDYSDLIEYTYIPAYNATYYANDTLLAAAESGFLGTQDVVLCDMVGSKVYNSQDGLLNDTLKAAHDSGSSLYSIRSVSSTPSYFDYVSDGNADDPICNYYNNMDTAGEGLDNAENLLLYLTMKTKVVYIGFSPSEGLEMASETNDYSDLIEYTYIPAYNATYYANDTLLAAAESGFLGTQDVVLCDMVGSKVYNSQDGLLNDTLKAAHDSGSSLYSIRSVSSTPSYFDYVSDGNADDPICNYYNNMDTAGEGLDNAETLLIYLATECPTLSRIGILGNDEVDLSEFVFVLGTNFNELSLTNASQDLNISDDLNITIFTDVNSVPEEFDFSEYGVIFIESQDESIVSNWTSSIKSAKLNGAMVIGYDLSSNVTLPNVDLYSTEYTDIERYWVQGGDTNMVNMLKFMGQEFCNAWANETIPEPVILQSKQKITYIINSDTSRYYFSQVLSERSVITDNFNVTVMSGTEAANFSDVSDQDVIMLYMIGANELPEFKDELLTAKASGTQIGLFGMSDVYGIGTIDMENAPHSVMKDYLYNAGYTNMENWIRCIGATLEDEYIEYSAPAAPSIPDHGIYHPDAFPRVFENSTEYLEWYAGNGYNASAHTIGVIANYNIEKTTLLHTTDDAIINNLESKGYNVIFSTYKVCTNDVDYFTQNGTLLVDSIISLKGFRLNYDNQEKGVEYLEGYDVPVIKGVLDYYQGPDQFNESVHGVNPSSIPSHVTQPEIDGLIDYIWLAGRVTDQNTQQKYYEPQMQQLDWMCDRAISWAELGHVSNANKKVSIIYYNHEGGKNNIGASYLDIGSSFTLLLEQMQADGYDIGNGAIPNASEFIDRFIESRNVGSWAPGELEKVVNSGNVTLVPVDEYLAWYNTLPQSVQDEVEARWGEAPGNIMVYENKFVIPTVQLGNINFIPQPTRGDLSDESVMYHDKSIPPTHQYLATYFWINNVYDTDAMIHFGTHGTQEWLPGKEVGLWKYDYPSIMVADTPVVYPYIMDNVGEGTQAKRRGNAVIIDHLVPAITNAGLYGELATMHDKLHRYEEAKSTNNTAMMALYRDSMIGLYTNLSMENDLGVTPDQLRAMTEDDYTNFISVTLHDHLHKLQGTLMPLGLHTLGVAPQDEKLVTMVKSMLRSDFMDHIINLFPYVSGHEDDWEVATEQRAYDLLNATLLNGTDVSTAQLNVLNLTDANITSDLNLAIEYSVFLSQTSREIDETLHALNAGYIEPGPGNDPIRNPEALPTGRNFYSFDQRKFPDVETTAMGTTLADQLVQQHYATHNNTYPNKVAYVLWSVETMRHHGLMEAQIYSLLGVEPVRSSGRLTGFEVIPLEDMNHPRIDVVITPSGLYRDTFPYQLELIDEAVRTVAALNETNQTNYVRWNSLKMEDALLASGYNNTTAQAISQSRIFSESPGSYGTGLPGVVTASETWDSEDKLADLYMSRMSNIYGQDMWGESYEDVFRMNLMDVDAAVHSDTSNLYGLIDNDDFYQYLGGLGLAVRSLTGENPEMYVADLTSVDDPGIITLNEAFRNELRARNFNPKWISGMMEYDYAGAREFMKFTDNLWGWDVMTPDMVTDSDWNEIYDIYVMDKYDLDVDEFLKTENPYQYQSILTRMIETDRKEYWDASDETLQNLVREYAESVVEDGVTCCHHTCGNALLNEYIQGIMSVPGVVSQETIDEYNRLMEEATQRNAQSSAPSTRSSSGSTASASIVNSTSTSSDDGGYGTTTDQPAEASQQSTPDNYVEGYEMTKESTTSDSASSSTSFSGADILGSVLVVLAVAVITIGFRRRRL